MNYFFDSELSKNSLLISMVLVEALEQLKMCKLSNFTKMERYISYSIAILFLLLLINQQILFINEINNEMNIFKICCMILTYVGYLLSAECALINGKRIKEK